MYVLYLPYHSPDSVLSCGWEETSQDKWDKGSLWVQDCSRLALPVAGREENPAVWVVSDSRRIEKFDANYTKYKGYLLP